MPDESERMAAEEQQDTQETLTLQEKAGIIEAILFVAGNAVEIKEIAAAIGLNDEEMEDALTALESELEFGHHGLRLLRFGKHAQLATRVEYAPYVERLLQPIQKQSLSQAVMETLAVIAYRQPVTKGEIEQIRGVKCDYSVQSLLNKGLIEEQGRRETLGRPILYGTTDDFLRHFGIESLDGLPEIDFAGLEERIRAASPAADLTIQENSDKTLPEQN